jgi:hypothetical protein
MWRIQALTEQFGMCGIGWYYTVDNRWIEDGSDGQKCAFVEISLYVKVDGEWSMPIYGTGGSMLTAKESSGLRTSDECYKMANTDALSVACKQLGFAADVYWEKGESKYNQQPAEQKSKNQSPAQEEEVDHRNEYISESDKNILKIMVEKRGYTVEQFFPNGLNLTKEQYVTASQTLEKIKVKEGK